MTTIFPKDPKVTERSSVILSEAERRNIRRKLRGTVEVAQDALRPRNQIKRLMNRGKNEAARISGETAQLARKNAPVIGAVGLGAVLYAARKPISKWLSKLRKSKTPTPDGE